MLWHSCFHFCSKTRCCHHLSQEQSLQISVEIALGSASETPPGYPLILVHTTKTIWEERAIENHTFPKLSVKLTWDVDSIWNTPSLVFIRISHVEQLNVTIGQHGLQLRVGHRWSWGGNIKDRMKLTFTLCQNKPFFFFF